MGEWENISDDKLAFQCSRRPTNEDAWLEFWRRFQPLIQRRVLLGLARFTGHVRRADLDDIVQIVFVKILQSLGQFDPTKGQLRAYLSALATNALIDELRQRKNVALPLDEVRDTLAIRPSETDLLSQWDAVTACLAKLGRDKAAIVAEYLEGGDVGDISRKHSVTPGSIYTTVSRFRKELRRALEKR